MIDSYGVITQVTTFAQCLAYGTGQAAQPIISQNFGAGQFGRIKECLKYGLYTCAVAGVFWTMAMTLVPNLILNFFMNPTPSVLEIAPAILRTYGISYLLLPFNVFMTYYFQAIMKSNISVLASLARGLVVSGVTIMLLPAIFGANSIWYAMLVTELLVAAFGMYYMVKSKTELSGMLLYAKTEEAIVPDFTFGITGNQISVKTLDLNKPFALIAKQLDDIAKISFDI